MREEKTTVNQEELEMQNEAAEQQEADAALDEQEQAGAAAAPEAPEGDLAAEVERWKALAEENQNRYLRAMADMENMRKRVRKEQDDLAKYASLKVIAELLPVLDNFERALASDRSAMTVDSLLEGVNMVYRQMVQVFEKEGLTPIEAAGKPFDPHLHQAVMQVEDAAYESGVVVEELQKGYQFKDRVIRPAMVKVNA